MSTESAARVPDALGRRPGVEATERHAHDTVQVCWVRAGAGTVYCRGGTHAVAPGSVVVIPPGEMHHGHSVGSGGWSYGAVEVAPARLREAGGPRGRGTRREPGFAWVARSDPVLAGRLARWGDGRGAPLERDVLLSEALSALARSCCRDARPDGREAGPVRRAVDFLEAHPDRNVRLDQLAGVARLSKFHLVRVFRREVGVPPHAYHLQVRLRRAMRLLREGRSISRAAFATGFSAQSHLHRHFRRVLGVTPGEYVRQVRAA